MIYKMPVRCGVFALLLLTFSCNIFHDAEPEGLLEPTTNARIINGSFHVEYRPPLWNAEGYSAFFAKIWDGPNPSFIIWEDVASSGGCRLLTPRYPSCEPPCGGGALCVEDGQCQSYPSPVSAGILTVEGLKAKTGETSFSMINIAGYYHVPGNIFLDFPPCAEGDTVTLSAGGDSSVAPFTLTAIGISPLEILNDSIILEEGRPINLSWKPPDQTDIATISVLVDIDCYHGSKSKIECNDISDNGFLEIPDWLLDALKALGVSGFPKIEITRRSVSFNPTVKVEFAIESTVTKMVTIPGFISCDRDDECPQGQTCERNGQCK